MKLSTYDTILKTGQRVRVLIKGSVQGVGFRPFVYRLAAEYELKGWVRNSPAGVIIEAEGNLENVENFLLAVRKNKPLNANIASFEASFHGPAGYETFDIQDSDQVGLKSATILADISTCQDCLSEIFDPSNRRYLYPFTNCVNCGPRYSIITALPYDRRNTSMNMFHMCQECQDEFDNPLDRRFHAQPNACPNCGPQVELWDSRGICFIRHHDAIIKTVEFLKQGSIVAVKGVGGFHLFVDARNNEAVEKLRVRKHREEKPFALMFPSIEEIGMCCDITSLEKELLCSKESPVVLVKHKKDHKLAGSIAPHNPYFGVMLPFSPLHHILMRELKIPVVATSANISDEPICFEEKEAVERLKGITDYFLVHNRPIIRPIDDSIMRSVNNRMLMIRRARGFAPLPIQVPGNTASVLALGAHMKNTVALKIDNNVFVSQHLGDLQTQRSQESFEQAIVSLANVYDPKVSRVACDMHPEYLSTKKAQKLSSEPEKIQHHHAHVAACMAENQITDEILGICWDGTGWGLDNTIWGGEFLSATLKNFKRTAAFRSILLPGGEKAINEPRRAALSILYELSAGHLDPFADLLPVKSFTENEIRIMKQALQKKINAPRSTSVGRLFDALASLLGIAQRSSFEGQAAMRLEHLCDEIESDEYYKMNVILKDGLLVIDWAPMFLKIIDEIREKNDPSLIAVRFHNSLVESSIEIARRIGLERIVLSGGCFQNKYLSERMIKRLEEEKFIPIWHHLIPPNDGGISLGQAVVASSRTS